MPSDQGGNGIRATPPLHVCTTAAAHRTFPKFPATIESVVVFVVGGGGVAVFFATIFIESFWNCRKSQMIA